MTESTKGFNHMAFFNALDTTRQVRNLNWKQVASQTLVGTSTLTRMAQGKRPDADSLAALAAWSGLNPADYVENSSKSARAEPLAMISSVLRSDPKLSEEHAIALEEMLKSAYKQFAKRNDKT